MGLRDKVALVLTAVLLQTARTDCKPQSLRPNPFESYVNNVEKGKFTTNYITKESQYYNNNNHGQDVYVSPTFYKAFNFPEVDFPSDTSPKESFMYKPGPIGTTKATSTKMFDSTLLNNLRKEARMKRKSKKQFNTNMTPERTLPRFEQSSQPFYAAEMGTFPEVEYPLSAMDAWTPKYWNSYTTDDPFTKPHDYEYQTKMNTKQEKPKTYIKPSSMKENKGLFAVVKKSKEKINKEVTTTNVLENRNNKQISTSKSKIETKTSNDARNTTISKPSLDRQIRRKSKKNEKITTSQRKNKMTRRIKSKSTQSRSRLKALTTETSPYLYNNTFNCSVEQKTNNSLNTCNTDFTNKTIDEISTNDNNDKILNNPISISLSSNIDRFEHCNDSRQSQVICDSQIPNTVSNIISNNVTHESLTETIAYNENPAISEIEKRNDDAYIPSENLDINTDKLVIVHTKSDIILDTSNSPNSIPDIGTASTGVISKTYTESTNTPDLDSNSFPDFTQDTQITDNITLPKDFTDTSITTVDAVSSEAIRSDNAFSSILPDAFQDTKFIDHIADTPKNSITTDAYNLPIDKVEPNEALFYTEPAYTDSLVSIPLNKMSTTLNATVIPSSQIFTTDTTKSPDKIPEFLLSSQDKLKTLSDMIPNQADVLQSQLKLLSTSELRGLAEKILAQLGPVPQEYEMLELDNLTESISSYTNPLPAEYVIQTTVAPEKTDYISFTDSNPTEYIIPSFFIPDQLTHKIPNDDLPTNFIIPNHFVHDDIDTQYLVPINSSDLSETIKSEEFTDQTPYSEAYDLLNFKLPEKKTTTLTEPISEKYVTPPSIDKNNDLIKITKNPADQSISARVISDLTALHDLVESILVQVGQVPKEYISDTIKTKIQTGTNPLPVDYITSDKLNDRTVPTDFVLPDQLNDINRTVPTDFILPDKLNDISRTVPTEFVLPDKLNDINRTVPTEFVLPDELNDINRTVPTDFVLSDQLNDINRIVPIEFVISDKLNDINRTVPTDFVLPDQLNDINRTIPTDFVLPDQLNIINRTVPTEFVLPDKFNDINLTDPTDFVLPDSFKINSNVLNEELLHSNLQFSDQIDPLTVPIKITDGSLLPEKNTLNSVFEKLTYQTDPTLSKITMIPPNEIEPYTDTFYANMSTKYENQNDTLSPDQYCPLSNLDQCSIHEQPKSELLTNTKLTTSLIEILSGKTNENPSKDAEISTEQNYTNENLRWPLYSGQDPKTLSDSKTRNNASIIPDFSSSLMNIKTSKILNAMKLVAKLADILNYSTVSNNNTLLQSFNSDEPLSDVLKQYKLSDFSGNDTLPYIETQSIMFDDILKVVISDNDTLSGSIPSIDKLLYVSENGTMSAMPDNDTLKELQENDTCKMLENGMQSVLVQNSSLSLMFDIDNLSDKIYENKILTGAPDSEKPIGMPQICTTSDIICNETLCDIPNIHDTLQNITLSDMSENNVLSNLIDYDTFLEMPNYEVLSDLDQNYTLPNSMSDVESVSNDTEKLIFKYDGEKLTDNVTDIDALSNMQDNETHLHIRDYSTILDVFDSYNVSDNEPIIILNSSSTEYIPKDENDSLPSKYILAPLWAEGITFDSMNVLSPRQSDVIFSEPLSENINTDLLTTSTVELSPNDISPNTQVEFISTKSLVEGTSRDLVLENNYTKPLLEKTLLESTSTVPLLHSTLVEPVQGDTPNVELLKNTSTKSFIAKTSSELFLANNSTELLLENTSTTDTSLELLQENAASEKIKEDTITESLLDIGSSLVKVESNSSKILPGNYVSPDAIGIEKTSKESVVDNIRTKPLTTETIRTKPLTQNYTTHRLLSASESLQENSLTDSTHNTTSELFQYNASSESLFENNHTKTKLEIIPTEPPGTTRSETLLENVPADYAYAMFENTSIHTLADTKDLLTTVLVTDVSHLPPVMRNTDALSDTIDNDALLKVTEMDSLPNITDTNAFSETPQLDILPQRSDSEKFQGIADTGQLLKPQGTNDLSDTSNSGIVSDVTDTHFVPKLQDSDELLGTIDTNALPTLFDTEESPKLHSTVKFFDIADIDTMLDETNLPTILTSTEALLTIPYTEKLPDLPDIDKLSKLRGTDELLNMAYIETSDVTDKDLPAKWTGTDVLSAISDTEKVSYLPHNDGLLTLYGTEEPLEISDRNTVTNELLDKIYTDELPDVTDTSLLATLSGADFLPVIPNNEKLLEPEIGKLPKLSGTDELRNMADTETLSDVTDTDFSTKITGTNVLSDIPDTEKLSYVLHTNGLFTVRGTEEEPLEMADKGPDIKDLLDRAQTDALPDVTDTSLLDTLSGADILPIILNTEKLLVPNIDKLPILHGTDELRNMAGTETLSDMTDTDLSTQITGIDVLLDIQDTEKLSYIPKTEGLFTAHGTEDPLEMADKDTDVNKLLDKTHADALPDVTDISLLATLSGADVLPVILNTEKLPDITETDESPIIHDSDKLLNIADVDDMLSDVSDTDLLTTQTGTEKSGNIAVSETTNTALLPDLPGTDVLSQLYGTDGLLDIVDTDTILDVTDRSISKEVTDLTGTGVPITPDTAMLRDIPSTYELPKVQSTDQLLDLGDTDTFSDGTSNNLPSTMTVTDKLVDIPNSEKLPDMPNNDELPKLHDSHKLLNMADIDTLSQMTNLQTILTGKEILPIMHDTEQLRDTSDTDELLKLHGTDELDEVNLLNLMDVLQDIPDNGQLLKISDTNISPKQHGTDELDMAYNAGFSDVTDTDLETTITGTDISQVVPGNEMLPDVFPKVQDIEGLIDISATDTVAEVPDIEVLSEVPNSSALSDLFTADVIPTTGSLPEMQNTVDAPRIINDSDPLPDSLYELSDMPSAKSPEMPNHVALPVKLDTDIPNMPDSDTLSMRDPDALPTMENTDKLSPIWPVNLQEANASQKLPVDDNLF